MINIGTNFETSKKAVEIAQKHEKGVFASIGLHPINLDTGLVKIRVDESEGSHFEKEFDYEKYKELAKSQKVVAIGEIGLDYYWKPKTKRKLELFKEKQRTVLCQQLNLARELSLPVIFHCRMAHQDLIKILAYDFNDRSNYMQGVMHGFVGTLDQLKEYLKMGFYIGFNGIIFKKIEGIKVAETSSHLPPRATSSRSVFEENIKNTPLEKILIETDCPYLTPPNFPEKRNNPLGVKQVAQKIAEIKNLDFGKVAEITTKNAKDLFKL
jgi:TatD DNase family protein